jgi:putative phage-type endonuclease
MIQGSPEWLEARLGKVTASRIADVIAKTKTGVSASRGTYMAELIAERLTGKQSPSFSNSSMLWGTECEPLARAAYEAETGAWVTECGIIDHPTIAMTGASPDGLIGDDGTLEIKCPETKAHIETLIAKKAPTKYIPQMMWQMACTGRQWCDFVSFDPRMPEHLQIFKTRVPRDEKLIAEIEAVVTTFLLEINEIIEKLGESNVVSK